MSKTGFFRQRVSGTFFFLVPVRNGVRGVPGGGLGAEPPVNGGKLFFQNTKKRPKNAILREKSANTFWTKVTQKTTKKRTQNNFGQNSDPNTKRTPTKNTPSREKQMQNNLNRNDLGRTASNTVLKHSIPKTRGAQIRKTRWEREFRKKV